MSEECMCPPEAGAATCEWRAPAPSVKCPTCGQKGKRVDFLTLKALLAVSLTDLQAVEYVFCRTPDCPIVYYSFDGQQQFGEDALRERVHQKHPSSNEM